MLKIAEEEKFMRYCTRCGNLLEGERFCTKCGTDNGTADVKKVRPINIASATNNGTEKIKSVLGAGKLTLNIQMVFHWAAIILFFISMVVLIHHTISMGTEMTASFFVKSFGPLYIAVYFFLSLWSAVPAVRFVLECGSAKKSSVIKAATGILILTLIFSIWNLVMVKMPNSVIIPNIIRDIKSTGLIYLIYRNKLCVLSVLTILSEIAGIKLEQKEGR